MAEYYNFPAPEFINKDINLGIDDIAGGKKTGDLFCDRGDRLFIDIHLTEQRHDNSTATRNADLGFQIIIIIYSDAENITGSYQIILR